MGSLMLLWACRKRNSLKEEKEEAMGTARGGQKQKAVEHKQVHKWGQREVVGVKQFWVSDPYEPQVPRPPSCSVEVPARNSKPQLISPGSFSQVPAAVSLTAPALCADPAALCFNNKEDRGSAALRGSLKSQRLILAFELFYFFSPEAFLNSQ